LVPGGAVEDTQQPDIQYQQIEQEQYEQEQYQAEQQQEQEMDLRQQQEIISIQEADFQSRSLERLPEETHRLVALQDQDQNITIHQVELDGSMNLISQVPATHVQAPAEFLSQAGEEVVVEANDLQPHHVIHLQVPDQLQQHQVVQLQQQQQQEKLQLETISEEVEQKTQLVNLKKPVFFSELHSYYASSQHTDTVLQCSDGQKRVHSIVLGAASSLFRFMFDEISEKILDSDYLICLPDLTVQELEELLKPVYGMLKEGGTSTVNTQTFGFNLDFNSGEAYQSRLKEVKEKTLKEERERKPWLIPEEDIKQELRKGKKGKHGYAYDSFVESSDDESRVKNKTKHGYKYDSFVESDSDSDEIEDEEDVDDDLFDDKPKKRGRKKGSKNTRKYTKRVKSEPLLSVKEEAIDKTFDEFNEMFLQKTQVTRNAEIRFAQDHIGFYHCQEDGCSFKTMVRPSVHQHHKFSHQNLHGYQEALLNCQSCGESWVNQIYYRKHVDSNECKVPNPVIPYVCENCGQGWYNLTNYTKHAEARECKTNTSHEGKKPCSNASCPLTFFSDKNRETHEARAHKPVTAGTMYRCAKCNINFINHKDYNKHKKDVHAEKPRGGYVVYVCKVIGCEYSNAERKIFESHVREAHPDECFICDLCGRNFSDQLKLEQHQANNPGGRGGKRCLPVNYNCPHCPREFNRKRHMELHVLFKHTQERPYSCEQCGKRFKTRQCVRLHMRSHGIGGYGGCCEECGKTFNQISAYHTHLKVHSNVRDFACEDCGMTFKLKHSLKKHQLVHKPEFGHTCDFCGKKFKRSDNLINHRRRHTGEHPYKCDKCNWTGPDSSSFIHHKKKHTDVVHNTQELKLIHAISKLPGHLIHERDPINGAREQQQQQQHDVM